MFRAAEYYHQDNGGIRTAPFFKGTATTTAIDGDSDDEDSYSHPETVYTVYRRPYNNDRDQVVSKFFTFFILTVASIFICIKNFKISFHFR